MAEMSFSLHLNDTIVAPATAIDRPAALSVLRLSGPQTDAVLARVFRTKTQELPQPRIMTVGTVTAADGTAIDQAMAVRFTAPNSYTGEHCAELQLHGSPAVANAALQACVAAGARLATPGEFTRRAFLNGKLDLAQAEAVADLTTAEGTAARTAALRQLRGGLSTRVAALRDRLLDVAAEVECRLDWADDEVEQIEDGKLEQWLTAVRDEMSQMLAAWRRAGRLVRDGARVVLVGEPNAGKSSLFNAIVGRERAIVTPHAGTTRDTLETTLELAGIMVTLIDTAGLRDAQRAGDIERIGIERSRREMQLAELVILVVDATRADEFDDTQLRDELVKWLPDEAAADTQLPVTVVFNKTDLLADNRQQTNTERDALMISAKEQSGIDALENEIVRRLTDKMQTGGGAQEADLVTNTRHAQCIERAETAVNNALQTAAATSESALVMVDVHLAVGALNELLGLDGADDLLDRIFGRFCLGK